MLQRLTANRVEVADTEVHWVELGDGPPLVLLHGLTDSHRTWALVAPALAAGRRVLMPDLQGHGLSGRPDAGYELAWQADVISAWIDRIGLDQLDLVGHSYGGGVAQWMLLRESARVRRLALVAPGGVGRDVSWSLKLASLPFFFERMGQPFFGIGTRLALPALGPGFDANDAAEMGWMNARPGTARAVARTVRDVIDIHGQRRHFLDRAADLGELPPMALLWGDRDPILSPREFEQMSSTIEGLRTVRFPGTGHFPHREHPRHFALALNDFLDDPAMGPASIRKFYSIPAPPPRVSIWTRAWRGLVRGARWVLRLPVTSTSLSV
jgi:pimeloyl-ACP methyl ester carboxylesterase